MYPLIETAKLSGIDPKAWLDGVLDRIAGHCAQRLNELPWDGKAARQNETAKQAA